MNPRIELLRPYPFERLRALAAEAPAPAGMRLIDLSIGEPKHATPAIIADALQQAVGGLSVYPATAGLPELRRSIAEWLARRFPPCRIDPETEVLPVNGSREALFSAVQAVLDSGRPRPLVICPNPFYQIYEGAALLAGAVPVFASATAVSGYKPRYGCLDARDLADAQAVFVCSPGNPAGAILDVGEWAELFALSDRYGFVILSDECYSELYYTGAPPAGALGAAARLGRAGYPRLLVFSSLSKRSNAPGLRSGFVAGDRHLLGSFLRYRTYQGGAMSVTVQRASIAAWSDESHVLANRALYAQKYDHVLPLLSGCLPVQRPQGGFYLWVRTPIDDVEFARRLLAESAVRVLPGAFLSREVSGVNPGASHVRIALVPPLEECVEAARRIADFMSRL